MPELTLNPVYSLSCSSSAAPSVSAAFAPGSQTALGRSGHLPPRRPSGLACRLAATVLICVGGTALLATPASAADDFPGLERLMTVEQFRRTGLPKLSDSELEALNEWLIEYTAGDAQVLQGTSTAVRDAEKNMEIDSRISGEFTGWDGDTIFRLENGQVWQQRLGGRYPYRGPANPTVRISKNFMGFYKMTILESGKSIGVKRLR